jgi:hypothetical protein
MSMLEGIEMVKDYDFEEVDNLPDVKRSRTGQYTTLLEDFVASGKSTVRLNWKGKAAPDTVAVSLRKAVKANPLLKVEVMTVSRINPDSKKREVKDIYLSKKEEPEHKKKGK